MPLERVRKLMAGARDGAVLDLNPDDFQNGKWIDRSGFGNHGTIYGATPVDSPYGKVLQIIEDSDYVVVADNDAFHTKEFTVGVVVSFLDFEAPGGEYDRNPVIVQKNWPDKPSWCMWVENILHEFPGKLHFDFMDSSGTRRNTVIAGQLQLNKYYVIHGVYDGCKSRIYVDCEFQAEMDQECNDFTNTASLMTGRPGVEWMHGYIACLRYFMRALAERDFKPQPPVRLNAPVRINSPAR